MSTLRNPALIEPIQSDVDKLEIANQTIDELNQKITKLKAKNERLLAEFFPGNERDLEIARAQVKTLCNRVNKVLDGNNPIDNEVKTAITELLGLTKKMSKQLDALIENDGSAAENPFLAKELEATREQLAAAKKEAAEHKAALENLKREHEALMEEELHALVQAALAEMTRYRNELMAEVPARLRDNVHDLARQLLDEEINNNHVSLRHYSYPEIEAIRKIGAINRLEANLLSNKPVQQRCRDVLETYNSQNGKYKQILERNRDTWLTAILKIIGVTLSLGSLWKPIYHVKGSAVTQTIQTLFHPAKLQNISDSVKLRQRRARSVASSQQDLRGAVR